MRPLQFEFVDAYRGQFVPMCAADGTVTILVDWPASFLAMMEAGVLGPKARKEAEALLDAGVGHRGDLEPDVYYRGRCRRVDVVARL